LSPQQSRSGRRHRHCVMSVCLSVFVCVCALLFSPVSIQTQALIGWRLRLLKNASAISQQECSVEAAATMIGCLPPQALAFLAVFVHATHATQAIAFEWKPSFPRCQHCDVDDVGENYNLPSFGRRPDCLHGFTIAQRLLF